MAKIDWSQYDEYELAAMITPMIFVPPELTVAVSNTNELIAQELERRGFKR